MSTAFLTIERGVTEDGKLAGRGCVPPLGSPKHASFYKATKKNKDWSLSSVWMGSSLPSFLPVARFRSSASSAVCLCNFPRNLALVSVLYLTERLEMTTMNKHNILKLALLLCAAACSIVTGTLLALARSEAPSELSQRTLTFAERVAYQRAIEDVYWRHRIWPKENLRPKPSLDEVMSAQQIERKVEDYLRDSQALQAYWQKPIAPEQLQAEMERMAQNTKQPEVLRELFEALGQNPFVIAECLARPVLTERLVADLSANDKGQRFALLRTQAAFDKFSITTLGTATYILPEIDPCTDDTWTATSTTNAPDGRLYHTAVWTGSEMIVWGGTNGPDVLNTGGRYNPSTDSWAATSTTNAPVARDLHTAVWTGSEMIVWGGDDNN